MFRRAEERTRTSVAAQITQAGRIIDCVVRDMSSKGARLRVPDAGAVPQMFELLLKTSGETRPARVRWRKDKEVGIAFVAERRGFGRRQTPPVPTGAA